MIDLHAHSNVSDGTDRPADLVAKAAEAGLSALALTDHDILDGIPEARVAAERTGVRLVPGCELSCEVDRGTLHLVVLFVDAAPGPLPDRLAGLRRARDIRNEQIVTALRDGAGFDLTVDEVLEEAGGGSVGRPHVAAVLLRKGYVASFDEAFERWLARGRPAYVEREHLTPVEAIDLAHRSSAVTVLAHPLSLDPRPEELEAFVGELAGMGLDGIEVEYGRYAADERQWLLALADRSGLAPSGGSDYHGAYKPDLSLGVGLGDLRVPDEWLDGLEARRPAP